MIHNSEIENLYKKKITKIRVVCCGSRSHIVLRRLIFYNILNDFILVFNYSLRVFFFPVLGTSDITEAYEVGDRRHAYIFFTVVAF